MLTFVKLGGSVITDKTGREAPDLALIRQLASEAREALAAHPRLRLVLGHGSGSFGHPYAERYGVHKGIPPGGDWMGFALTAASALRLNRIVVDEFLAAGVPALALQPSATLSSAHGEIAGWDTTTIGLALERELVPVIHGDVAFDTAQGSAIISTEQLLAHLARSDAGLRPARIILVGESGVYSADPRVDPQARRIARIDSTNIAMVLQGAGGSHGVDVTGGMRSKVELMWSLAQSISDLQIHLIGPAPGLLARALLGTAGDEGTMIAV